MTKPLHGQFLRQTQQTADSKSWAWLTTGGLKKETEGFLMAAQDQALRTNAIKVKIDKQEGEATCRMCKNREETVTHIISGCCKLVQLGEGIQEEARQSRRRCHIWSLCETYHIKRSEQWYQHTTEPVIETENVKILWDMNIQTDHVNTDDQAS